MVGVLNGIILKMLLVFKAIETQKANN